MMKLTSTVQRNLDNIQFALDTSNAVLIQGEIGCGKSASVSFLAEKFQAKETMIQVNVDDTFDSKDLLGKFSATETPGAFEWVPGPLTVAVQNGYWVLMEDIDLASFDVFSVILSLLENSMLFISDKNKFIRAHPGFKLIGTQQLFVSGSALLTRKTNSVPYAELWDTVIMEKLPPEEMCLIAESSFPNVPLPIIENLAGLVSPTTGVSLAGLQKLLRWTKRVSKRLSKSNSSNKFNSSPTNYISSTIREIMVREAFDCFVARYAPGVERDAVLKLVGEACGVPENVAEPLVLNSKPLESLGADVYTIGRVNVPLISTVAGLSRDSRVAFAPTVHALSLLERLAAAVESKEHVLLTGETGVGKTFIVQYLADQLGQSLIVHNLNQQTDTSDFMGGWKPLDVGVAVRDLYRDFTSLFAECFNVEKNAQFLNVLLQGVNGRKWDRVVQQVIKGCCSFKVKNAQSVYEDAVQSRWSDLEERANEALDSIEKSKANFAFFFEEGSLIKAWREGHWILLDELNLASTEVLERVSSVLGDVDRLFLTDKSSSEPIMRHENFHVFANMNPPTDVGKKDLPPSLRSRFVEYYVNEPFNRNDISIVVKEYIGFLTADAKVDEITDFFLDCVGNAKTKLCSLDGESKPPSFSLRTLTRALSYVRRATPLYGFAVALFDGLLLGFATPLQRQFHAVVEQLIVKNIFRGKRPHSPSLPAPPKDGVYIAYEHIWIGAGSEKPFCDEGFILTTSVKQHLTNLGRAVFANRPVLLEGPTSSGKSSMVKYLAELSGNRFVRINNHDSTEVQEYLGHYVTDEHGKLRYVDGILVNAVRHGYWVVLDELNLAPTDVLEALNRLLDDNCELFVSDTQETIKPHPHLRIFATQNPAGIYGGRKMLSRAFRNRFLEITVDEIPTNEISNILCRRYSFPERFAERMVEVMTALQIRRQNSQIFAGRHGFITPRDLFRWAERNPTTYQELAEHGFLLLGERCRKESERQVVKDVIESVMKTEIDETQIYRPGHWPFVQLYYSKIESGVIDEFKIVWTESMQRLFTIVGICLQHKEPILLVGETGSSKTTVCQLWSALLGTPLHILNCHQHTEAADFLGSLRPVPPDRRDQALFEWRNGPLVQSMLDGDMFVLDEISLTEDSVLERLNSVLEPSRSVTLAEKSSADCIVAHEQFRVMATMNPGGDFGKKELSPALRNRFTEIYVRPTTDVDEIAMILSRRLEAGLELWAPKMAGVLCRVSKATANSGAPQHISIRDIIGWVAFMNAAHQRCPPEVAFLQGLDAVILDGIGVGSGQSESSCAIVKDRCAKQALQEVADLNLSSSQYEELCKKPFWEFFDGMAAPELPSEMRHRFFFGAPATQRNLSKLMRASIVKKAVLLEGSPGVGKTSIVEALGCAFGRPVVRINLSEQTDVMDLFGSFLPCPGVTEEGDAEDVTEASGVAANELPGGPQFAWSDGVLLRALKEGSWVILDELNLASQSVLEGLNALLDHRSTVFIPELNEEFHAHSDFRVFACQNPLVEGGGRKGLPKSFLNRFIKVHIEAFEVADLISIAKAVAPDISEEVLLKMVSFVGQLQQDTMTHRLYGLRGSPWEFNLRDVLRWAKILYSYDALDKPTAFADVLFFHRMRSAEDMAHCRRALMQHFSEEEVARDISDGCDSDFLIHDNAIYFDRRRLLQRVNTEVVPADATLLRSLLLVPSQAHVVKSILMCVAQNQFALLVGPSGAGKTFTLRTAAALAGAKLVTFSMTASCDTVDLLGGFDQVEGKQGQFEWRDSLVLEAMLQGHWLVLDNVNYCNASVLDRLNPLVEPNGVLSVNEQGLVNNEVRVVRPHPQFRLFATLNPRYGEISRAMRNRAVEMYVSPVAIPSIESLALCANASTREVTDAAVKEADDAAAQPSGELLGKLLQYHHTFVSVGFHTDSQKSGSSQLCDALAAGAPSVFTIVRTSRLLRPTSSKSELETLILHRYLQNRSGHWSGRREELRELLRITMDSLANEGASFIESPSPHDVLNALQLLTAEVQEEETATEGSAALVSTCLVSRRVHRAALPLAKFLSQAAPTWADGKKEEYDGKPSLPFFLSDVLLYFVLDQCSDSVSMESVTQARQQWIACHIPATLADSTSQVIGTMYTSTNAIAALFMRAIQYLGPHDALLRDLSNTHLHVTNSTHVNNALARLRDLLYQEMSSLHVVPPVVFHRLLRLVAPLGRAVLHHATGNNDVHNDNYIPLVTWTTLLMSTLEKGAGALHGSTQLLSASAEFLLALQTHLGLPFSLLGGKSPLAQYAPSLHITNAEERALLSQWRAADTPHKSTGFEKRVGHPTSSAELPHSTSTALLQTLWESSAFRDGFAIIQRLLHTRLSFPTDAPAQIVKALQDTVAVYLQTYTESYPLFSQLEMALWGGILRFVSSASHRHRDGKESHSESSTAIAELTPLLVSRFMYRHGVNGARHLLSGSWAASAWDCVRYASLVPVKEVGQAGGTRSQILASLQSFLTICPVAETSPFEELTRNTRMELAGVLCASFSDLTAQTPLRPMDAVSETSFFDTAQGIIAPSANLNDSVREGIPLVEAQKPLVNCILRMLRSNGGDVLPMCALVWILKCRLLLPLSPIDPMYRRECKRDVASEEMLLLQRLEGAFAWAERVSMRHRTPQYELIQSLRQLEVKLRERAERKLVARPEKSGMRYASLVRQLYQICSTLLSDDRVLGLLGHSAASSEDVASREAWSDLLYEQSLELLDQYGGYEDVTLHFVESALLASMAARASSYNADDSSSSRALFSRSETLDLLQFPPSQLHALPLPSGNEMSVQLRHRLVYLDSCLAFLSWNVAQGTSRSFVEDVFMQYRSLYEQIEMLEAEERRAEETAVLYKEKATVIEGDDERLLQKLKSMFPSFEAEFTTEDDGDMADGGDGEKGSGNFETVAAAGSRQAKHARILLKERDGQYLRRLVQSHRHFYLRLISRKMSGGASAEDLVLAFQNRFDALAAELHRFPAQSAAIATRKGDEQLLLNGFAARSVLLQREMQGASVSLEQRRESGFNIFLDTDVYELRRFSKPLSALLAAVDELAQKFPDTPSLQRCLRIGGKIAALPAMSAPLMKVMAGCEVLLRECYEWERNASHTVSLMTYMTELSSFVLRWRRLELHCWSHVFKAKREEFEQHAAIQWFGFYSLLCCSEDNGEGVDREEMNEEEIANALIMRRCRAAFQRASQFMWAATFGDFTVRLRLLEGFGYQLVASEGADTPLTSTILHVCDFFAQFEALIVRQCSDAVRPIEEDIAEFTKIMRWEDANYYAVRATAEKSHLKMARVLSSLEEVLRTPVLSVISVEEQRCEDDPSMGFPLPSPAAVEGRSSSKKKRKAAIKEAADEAAGNGKRGKRRRSGHSTADHSAANATEKADALVHAVGDWTDQDIVAAYEFMQSSSEDVISRVGALQQPKTPNQLKVRALKTLFDTLSEAGVPHTHELSVAPWEVLFSTTEALHSCRVIYNDQAAAVGLLECAASEHYRFARWLQRMREAERKPHHDLSAAQTKRCTGTAESLFAHSTHLADLLCFLFHLHARIGVLEMATARSSETAEVEEQSVPRDFLDDAVEIFCRIQSSQSAMSWMLKEQVARGSAALEALLSELATVSGELWGLCSQYEPLRRSAATNIPCSVAELYFATLRSMVGILGRIHAAAPPSVATATLSIQDAVLAVLAQYDITAESHADAKRQRIESSTPSWGRQVQKVLDALDITLAEVTIQMSPVKKDDDDAAEAWGASTAVYARYAQRWDAMRASLQSTLRTCDELVAVCATTVTAAQRKALLHHLSAVGRQVAKVRQACSVVLQSHCYFGVVLTRLFTILIKKGFCKTEDTPEDEDDGDGDGGEMKDGTGMDDGEGEKDVTDQIENEDQLMNMKDKEDQPDDEQAKEQKKEEEGDGEEEDKAADVETDFNGEKEQRDESDAGSEEDGDESDVEMGSVDDGTEQERKKSRKDAGDTDEMEEDNGDAAEEVPEDDLAEDGAQDEETGGFDDKTDEIRDANRDDDKKDSEHDMVGDDEKDAMEDDGEDSDINPSAERSDGEDREESDVDKELSSNEDEDAKEAEEASEGRVDDDASTDAERSEHGEQEVDQSDEGDLSGSDLDDCSDAPDENVFEGGRQDDKVGDEATEREEKQAEERAAEKQQKDYTGNEEEQPGDEQEEDDAGRNWKRQQEQNDRAQRHDNAEQTRSQHNPYRAIKEALQRHQQQMQQLNLNQHVEVKDEKEDPQNEKHQRQQQMQEDVEEFTFDEDGENEGMAAAEEREVKPTETAQTEEELDQPSASPSDDEADGNDSEAGEAPQDTRRKRHKPADNATEVEKETAETKASRKSKQKIRTTARDEPESSDDSGEDSGLKKDAAEDNADEKLQRGRQLWLEQEMAVQGLSQQLCEQLRLILAPTLADKLQGDYKTGKRLNMKRIIPYIASQFKKDRIWLRRTKPSKRTYQVMVALDDSLSMRCNNAGLLSCRAVALIAKALQQLEIGEFGVACFGKETTIVHPLEEPFLADSGPRTFSEITFEQTSTSMRLMLETTLDYLDEASTRLRGQTRSTTEQLQQIMFVISDGQITEDRAELRKLMARAEENHQMVVFVLLDIKAVEESKNVASTLAGTSAAPQVPTTSNTALTVKSLQGLSTAERLRRLKEDRDSRLKRVQSNSILDMQLVEFHGGRVVRRSYMENFPFPYYLIVRDIENLPEIIADAMRQWFELLNVGL